MRSVCTVVVLIRPDQVLLAANRDERVDRAWDPPGAWWPDRPGVIAGRDRTGGGTWMGINQHGVVATVLNRPGTLGPAAGKRSRGELPLMALDHATAAAAAAGADPPGCRPLARLQHGAGGSARAPGSSGASAMASPPPKPCRTGVSMITAHDPNDLDSPRTARHLARFQDAEPTWDAWRAILSDQAARPAEQINVVPRGGFGTVSSSFVIDSGRRRPDLAVRGRCAACSGIRRYLDRSSHLRTAPLPASSQPPSPNYLTAAARPVAVRPFDNNDAMPAAIPSPTPPAPTELYPRRRLTSYPRRRAMR